MCGCVGRVRWASVMGKENGKVAVRATAGAAAMEKAMSSGKGGREGDGRGEKNSVGEEVTVRATARAAATATAMRGRRADKCLRRQRLVSRKMATEFALLKLPSWWSALL